MNNTFDDAFELLVGIEGGYQADRRDKGNWTSGTIGVGECRGTKFGISAASYPEVDIKNLTLADAKVIYRRDYWDKCRCDELPVGVDYVTFDIAVNHGRKDAIQWLQVAAGADPDGVFGPATLKAVLARDPLRLIEEMSVCRQMDFLRSKAWGTYGKGWTRRTMHTIVKAMKLIEQATLNEFKVEPKESAVPFDINPNANLLAGLFRRVRR